MEKLKRRVRNAIEMVQAEIRWRPGSETAHLLKRKVRNHLPLDATLADYEQIIASVVNDRDAELYVHWHEQVPYPTVVATVQGLRWLVMCDLDGVLESAFVVERPDRYLGRPVFLFLGRLGEILDNEL